ncbi:MAG: 16S rRNA (cytosine(967)-C(5))-methyltransferase RsmB [Lachnoclostridium sp.]|nr:16S rRNA (cytosine(967)-C(5))-methyltransferase RsmB [Lachnospira sp.]MCM1247158.1 16S rRNA (cytosine(967)-C(5))-methyltransferase RsmB [Lachnoclostridium sp.]MCM1534621.1 16S rRNA (cytosine(967)-C(5))-methyltransferase RsmB [Clostridium sp.]
MVIKMKENARESVLDILLTLEKEHTFSNKLIKETLDRQDAPKYRDKAFIKRIAEGTIERQIELDYYLNRVSKVPVAKMKPLIRCLLRMSAYQLLYMDAVPDSAVCNEACKLAEKRGFYRLKGFVNGVLRNLAKQKDRLPLPEKGEGAEFYSVKYSMPKWLVEMWISQYGEEDTETMLAGLLRIHPVSLRFRGDLPEVETEALLGRMKEAGAVVTQSKIHPLVYLVSNIDGVDSLPGYGEGAFMVQDASSVQAVEAAQIKEGDFVMDICAAPGGKSVFAAEKAGRTGKVLARDVSEEKLARIKENIERMKASNISIQMFDAGVWDEGYREKADVLLADVPCSGLGVMGKKRDIKYHVTRESLGEIVDLQKRILTNSWQYVKPGGILLYSTCTVHRGENEDMVSWIVENFPFEKEVSVQILPGITESDGFFYARLRRKT